MIAETHIQIDRQKIAEFCRKWRIEEFSLFGSVLREDFSPESDIDVLIKLQPDHGLSLYDWVDMIDELQAMFGRHVDLVEKTTIRNPFRRQHIMKYHEVIYAA